MKKVILEAGHDKVFQGAVGFRNEVDVSRLIQRQTLALLEGTEIKVLAVPEVGGKSSIDNLKRKIAWINNNSTSRDLLISLHLNAGGGTGVEVFYTSNKNKDLAVEYSKILSTITGLRDRGAKPDTLTQHKRLAILRETRPLALLSENGFVDSKIDSASPSGKFAYALFLFLLWWWEKK